MKCESRGAGNVRILDLTGRLCFGDGEEELGGSIAQCLAEGHRNIVVSLNRVVLIDSAGLGRLMAAKKRGLEKSAEIRLVIPHGSPVPLVVQTCLRLVFPVFEDEASAVRSFAR